MDRISNLPDVVIECILEKLSLVDQVRTSILSSGWRHRWAKIPSLVIDRAFYRFLSTFKPIPKQRRSNSNLLLNADYLNVINSLLVQHIGHLREFSLFIPNHQGLTPAYHLPVQSVLRNGTASLTLINEIGDYERFSLPLFSAVGLKHLTLKWCEIRLPPAFDGFPNLISFCQYGCYSDRSDTLSCLISSCPALEVVKVRGFYCHDRALNISSPRLRSLFLSGKFKSISLRSAQTIEIFNLFYTAFNTSLVDLNVIHNMANLKQFTLGGNTYKLLGKYTDLPRFSQMNRLSFYDVYLHYDFDDVLKCTLSLCDSSPNLKELDIKMQCYCKQDDTSESVIESFRDRVFDNLRTINIVEVSGLKSEMTLIELLLSRSPLLELMSIKVKDYVNAPSKKLTIIEDVAGFCRPSPNAKIKFLKHMNMNDDIF